MLSFPDYSAPFEVFTDASGSQIGAIIAQKTAAGFKPIAFFAAKMTEAQKRYTVTEQELLSVVTTLKKYKTMVFGYPINIYTDHKNLTFTTFQADRTIRWRLFVEEFGPKFFYIKGETNTGADALSRLAMVNSEQATTELMAEVYATEEDAICPIAYNTISQAQQAEFTHEMRRLWQSKKFGNFSLFITGDKRIRVPPSLQARILEWFHMMLMHPGSLGRNGETEFPLARNDGRNRTPCKTL